MRLTALMRLLGLVTAVAAAFAVSVVLVPRSSEELRAWVADLGAAGPLVFVVVGTVPNSSPLEAARTG